MSRNLFIHIVDAVKGHDNYFVQRSDGLGRTGLASLQKITAVLRMVMGEVEIIIRICKWFIKVIVIEFFFFLFFIFLFYC